MLQSATETTSLYRVSPLGAGRITRSSKQPHLTDPNSVSAPASPGSALIIFPKHKCDSSVGREVALAEN